MTLKIVEDTFGQSVNPLTNELETIKRFTFSNSNQKTSIQVITLGATITTLKLPDANGIVEDVVLGFDDVAGYQSGGNRYFGATIGRVCNRIGGGKFSLNGTTITVSKNNKDKHHLHGGFTGFDKVHWNVVSVAMADADQQECSLTLCHVSKDGHEGYPGDVIATVVFKLTKENAFHVNFSAVTSKTTAVNMTNHSYFNLAGHKSGSEELYDHLIQIAADRYTVVDEDAIPTGELRKVEGTAFDLRTSGRLGDRLEKLGTRGYDHNFCVNLKDNKTTEIARLLHPKSGRWMTISTNQPGVQFYTGNFLPNPSEQQEPTPGKDGAMYTKHSALCMETQKYPDSVNHTNFPSIILCPGEAYHHELIYQFGVKSCNASIAALAAVGRL